MQRTRVVVVSDAHINSTVGLCPPSVNLDDGGTYRYSVQQRALWRSWLDFCEKAHDSTDNVIVILNGDLVENGNKSTQVISRNKASILGMAYDAIAPLVEDADKVFVIRGTEYHTGSSADLEEAFAKDLSNVVPYKKKIYIRGGI